MPISKTIYLIFLCIIDIMLFLFLLDTRKKPFPYTRSLFSLLHWAFLGACAYGLYLLLPSQRGVTLADGIYFLATDFMCFFLMKFAFAYTEHESPKAPFEKALLALLCLDGLDLILNAWTGWMFTVESTTGKYELHALYVDRYRWLLYLHLTFCYAMVLIATIRFFVQARHSSPLYRHNYLTMGIPLLVAAAANVLCVCLNIPYDFSVLLYAVLAAIICFLSLHMTPNHLIIAARSAVADNTDLGIICFDERNQIIFINKVLQESDFIQTNAEELKQFLLAKHAEYENSGESTAEWTQNKVIHGRNHYFLCDYQKILTKRDFEMGYFFIIDDQTEKYEEFERNQYLATHDELTGLLNRRAFFEQVNEALQADPTCERVMLVSNISDFKLLNNVYGEAIADEALKLQSDFVRKYQTEGNLCGRITSDRFAMLMAKEKFDAYTFRTAVEEIGKYFKRRNIVIRYQIGMYEVTDPTESAQSIFSKAELAYSAAGTKSNELFAVYDQANIDQLMRKKQLIRDFDRALQDHTFCMYLQPQMDRTGTCTGAEALVRWQHPELGLLFPDAFIGVFEEAGLIHRLDLEIWNRAGAKLAEWKNAGHTDRHISVNISVRDLFYLDVYREMTGIVERNGIDPKNLKLEITESMVMLDRENNLDTLDKLRNYGFEIEIDDFGSGYSSLNMLKDFPADVLKIDRMFLKETENAGRGRIVLETTVNLAKSLGMQIVAEGVETEPQFRDLTAMGVDCFQGYYFDKPIPETQFEEKYLT